MKKIYLLMILLPQICLAESFSQKEMIFIEGRFGYGTKLSEQQLIKKIGLNNWMNQQLSGNIKENPELLVELSNLKNIPLSSILNEAKTLRESKDKEAIKELEKDLYERTIKKDSLLAIYSNNQLREKMTWFWFNHLNVYGNKGLDRLLYADYEENVIRKNALGNFRTLLLSSLKSPAMLFYLDNFQNTDPNSIINKRNPEKTKGINENYARELLELHTLGQGNDYSQKDIQELARILTGFTFRNSNDELKIPEKFKSYVVTDELFLFDPRKHDFGDKSFMGHIIKGKGYEEINDVLNILISNRHTANNISKKLAIYFVNDNPSNQLINKMSDTFLKTKGDIPSVLSVMFSSEEFWNESKNPSKFKLPNEYLYSVIRLTYDNKIISEFKPIIAQLKDLGQKPFGHLTPDGYGLKNKDWESSDQISKRFNLATLFNKNKTPLLPDYQFEYQNIFKTIEPILSENTKQVLEKSSPKEKIGYLLASPEMMNK